MWITYKKKVTYYRYELEGEVVESRYLWFRHRELVNAEEFYRWEKYEVWVGKKKYQKKPHHKKKEENPKAAWRAQKQTKRDKAKRQDLHGYRSDGCPVWMKRHCNKKHRQWERRCIERENYDELGTNVYKRKDIFDPWLWD